MHAVSEKTCSNNALRSLCFSGDGTRMLSSVDGCEVYELAVSDGSDVNAGALVRGHDANMELHGCASHPTRNEFVTAGKVKILFLNIFEFFFLTIFDNFVFFYFFDFFYFVFLLSYFNNR